MLHSAEWQPMNLVYMWTWWHNEVKFFVTKYVLAYYWIIMNWKFGDNPSTVPPHPLLTHPTSPAAPCHKIYLGLSLEYHELKTHGNPSTVSSHPPPTDPTPFSPLSQNKSWHFTELSWIENLRIILVPFLSILHPHTLHPLPHLLLSLPGHYKRRFRLGIHSCLSDGGIKWLSPKEGWERLVHCHFHLEHFSNREVEVVPYSFKVAWSPIPQVAVSNLNLNVRSCETHVRAFISPYSIKSWCAVPACCTLKIKNIVCLKVKFDKTVPKCTLYLTERISSPSLT